MKKFIIGLLIGLISGILIWDALKVDLHLVINPKIGNVEIYEKTGEPVVYTYRGFDFNIFKIKSWDGESIFNFGINKIIIE